MGLILHIYTAFHEIVFPTSLIFDLGNACILSKNVSSLKEIEGEDLVGLGYNCLIPSLDIKLKYFI